MEGILRFVHTPPECKSTIRNPDNLASQSQRTAHVHSRQDEMSQRSPGRWGLITVEDEAASGEGSGSAPGSADSLESVKPVGGAVYTSVMQRQAGLETRRASWGAPGASTRSHDGGRGCFRASVVTRTVNTAHVMFRESGREPVDAPAWRHIVTPRSVVFLLVANFSGCPMGRLSDRGSARVRIRSSWVHDPCLWPVQAKKLSPA